MLNWSNISIMARSYCSNYVRSTLNEGGGKIETTTNKSRESFRKRKFRIFIFNREMLDIRKTAYRRRLGVLNLSESQF